MKKLIIIIILLFVACCKSNDIDKECYIYKTFQNGIEISEQCNCYDFHSKQFHNKYSRTIEINTLKKCGETNGKN